MKKEGELIFEQLKINKKQKDKATVAKEILKTLQSKMKFDLNKAHDTQFRRQGRKNTSKDPVTPSNRYTSTLKYSSAGKSPNEKWQ